MNEKFIDITTNDLHDKIDELYESMHDKDCESIKKICEEIRQVVKDIISDCEQLK